MDVDTRTFSPPCLVVHPAIQRNSPMLYISWRVVGHIFYAPSPPPLPTVLWTTVFFQQLGGTARVRRRCQRGRGLVHPPRVAVAHQRHALHGVSHEEQTLERAQGGVTCLRESPHNSGCPQRLHRGGISNKALRKGQRQCVVGKHRRQNQ